MGKALWGPVLLAESADRITAAAWLADPERPSCLLAHFRPHGPVAARPATPAGRDWKPPRLRLGRHGPWRWRSSAIQRQRPLPLVVFRVICTTADAWQRPTPHFLVIAAHRYLNAACVPRTAIDVRGGNCAISSGAELDGHTGLVSTPATAGTAGRSRLPIERRWWKNPCRGRADLCCVSGHALAMGRGWLRCCWPWRHANPPGGCDLQLPAHPFRRRLSGPLL